MGLNFRRFKQQETIAPETDVKMVRYGNYTGGYTSFITYPVTNYGKGFNYVDLNDEEYTAALPETYHTLPNDNPYVVFWDSIPFKTSSSNNIFSRNLKFNGTILGRVASSKGDTWTGLKMYADARYIYAIGVEEYKIDSTVYGRFNLLSNDNNSTTFNITYITSTQLYGNACWGTGMWETTYETTRVLLADPSGATTFKLPKTLPIYVFAEDSIIINGTSYTADKNWFFTVTGSTCDIVFTRTRVGLLNWTYEVTVTADGLTIIGSSSE